MSETPRERRLDLDWVKVVAGALAAVSSAVLLSTLGAVGTVAGAALGSVIVSITSSLYSQGLARGTEKVAEAQTVALRKVGTATAEIQQVRQGTAAAEGPSEPAGAEAGTDEAGTDEAGTDEAGTDEAGTDEAGTDEAGTDDAGPDADGTDGAAGLERAEEQLTQAAAELEQAAEPATGPATDGLSRRQRLLALPWKRIGLAAGGLFLVAMVLVTAFEVVGGQSLSSYTERDGGAGGRTGTSIGDLLDRGGRSPTEPTETPSPSDDATRSPAPGGPATDRPTPSDDATSGPGGSTRGPDPGEDPSEDQTSEQPDEDTSEPTPTEDPTATDPASPQPSPTRTRRAG